MQRVRVAVVFGGRSNEHGISCVSAGGILRALDPSLFEAVPIGITRDGGWYLQGGDLDALRIVDGVVPEVQANGSPVVLSADPTVRSPELGVIDVVFPVLHGPWGEDGTIQGLLEMSGIPYVGSGVMASAVAMDKATMKALFASAGLMVGKYAVITDRQWRSDRAAAVSRVIDIGFPVFVKPARAGSSQGVSKVHNRDDLAPAIEAARAHDPRVIVEASVEGAREIECGVIEDETGAPRASRCAEIVVGGGHEFYDFEAKYLDDSADLVVPADLGEVLEAEVRRLACLAFEALGCEGLARVDFFIDPSGSVMINEVNTMPGFTPISMFPRMWEESGLAYPDLIAHLVRDAQRRGIGLR